MGLAAFQGKPEIETRLPVGSDGLALELQRMFSNLPARRVGIPAAPPPIVPPLVEEAPCVGIPAAAPPILQPLEHKVHCVGIPIAPLPILVPLAQEGHAVGIPAALPPILPPLVEEAHCMGIPASDFTAPGKGIPAAPLPILPPLAEEAHCLGIPAAPLPILPPLAEELSRPPSLPPPSSIASCFKDGRTFEDLIDDLATGRVEPLSAPFLKLDVVDWPGRGYFSIANR